MTQRNSANMLSRSSNAEWQYELPPLPYAASALEPFLTAETLATHYGKHHARYVETLNRLLLEENFTAHSLEEIVQISHSSGARALFNNAAQAWNHSFFWESMVPKSSLPGSLISS